MMANELTLGNPLAETAYHEAGHIVVAAATGLPLRPAGITVYEVVNNVTDGFAVYAEDEPQREMVLMALLAGVRAQLRQFPNSWIGGAHSDECKFREIVRLHFRDQWREMSEKLIPLVDQLLEKHWSAVAGIAERLVEIPWIPVQNAEHPRATRKKQLDGDAVAAILQRVGITSRVCDKS